MRAQFAIEFPVPEIDLFHSLEHVFVADTVKFSKQLPDGLICEGHAVDLTAQDVDLLGLTFAFGFGLIRDGGSFGDSLVLGVIDKHAGEVHERIMDFAKPQGMGNLRAL
ncbi:MAG: hypothetical protein ACPGVU_02145 [Limisphaerales bacterium]